MLGRVWIHNFRAIGPYELEALELAPLTILIGRNGVGKTAILESLALTAQSAIEQPRLMDLVLSGSRVDLAHGAASDAEAMKRIYFGGELDRGLSVAFEVLLDELERKRFAPEAPPPLAFLESWPPSRIRYEWMKNGALGTWSHAIHFDGHGVYNLRDSGGAGPQPLATLSVGSPRRGIYVGVHGATERVLPQSLFRFDYSKLSGEESTWASQVAAVLEQVRELLLDELSRISLLTPLRGAELMHHDVGPEVSFVGLHGEMTIRLLAGIQGQSSEKRERVRFWAEKLGLGDLVAAWSGGQSLKVAARDPHSRAIVDIDQAASGAKQGLTLVAQALLSPPASCLLIEEPENNMHPAFERLIAELFAETVAGGKQIIATTHSELLIGAIGLAVRKGLLRPEQVAIWHLDRDDRGVHAKRIPMTPRGYLAELAESFNAVERELFDEWQEGLPEAGPPDRD